MTNRTSAQMWPFVWRQCRSTTPLAPERLALTCMSRRRSMPILLWVLGRRAASALARWCCLVFRGFSASAAASAQSFRRIRLPCALALVSAPLWRGKRRRCPNHCAELRKRSLRPRAACQVCSTACFWAPILPLAGTAGSGKMKQGLRRLLRLSGARLGAYQRAYGGVRKILECLN